ncbi:hypothetical protein MBLNU459_g3641t1 [Dothideomycetes sp. NU459]
MAEELLQPALTPVARPLSLVPVSLKEAALDSPTFRALALHFALQFEAVEAWLKDYVEQTTRLSKKFAALQKEFDNFRNYPPVPPRELSEAALDHDYTLLATTRHGEGARNYFQNIFGNIARSRELVIDPVGAFIKDDLRIFKDVKDALARAQREFDGELARYSAQAKTKEPSSLREDAFKLHEAKKLYLKASMDFCIQAPNFRASLDRLLIKVFSDQWKQFRSSREATATTFAKWGSEMERIRGWSKEVDESEPAFKRELLIARRQIEDSAEQMVRPSRELEDYAASTVPYLGSGANLSSPAKPGLPSHKPEKQGWLYIKITPPKPARPSWSRRWFLVKNGLFGWLVQGSVSGGVEESEKVGVLLCSVRPAVQEERRFCFEVKTKDATVILQAETQAELLQWINSFELAKRKALEDPTSTESAPSSPGADAAFAIVPPVAPEFAAKLTEGHFIQGTDDAGNSLAASDSTMSLATRSSVDVTSTPRRSTMLDREGESNRDHAARIIQKLDLHRKTNANTQLNANSPASAGGIASLISASHNILPVGPGAPAQRFEQRSFTMPASTLAPSTLANPPAPTNLSRRAINLSGERATALGRSEGSSVPSGLMANLWGSNNWSSIHRLGRDRDEPRLISSPSSPKPKLLPTSVDDVGVMDGMNEPPKDFNQVPSGLTASPANLSHRKTASVGNALLAKAIPPTLKISDNYPLSLGTDDAANLKEHNSELHAYFQHVSRSEKVLLVFTAMWNPNEQQEFPGRVYVTPHNVYFYSNHFGMVLTTEINLTAVTEVTAAPGRESECDFLFLHLREVPRQPDFKRITVKTFLDPLKLLQRRMDFLVRNANSDQPVGLEEIFQSFTRMATERQGSSGSLHSWEEFAVSQGEEAELTMPKKRSRDLKTSLRIDGALYGQAAGRTGREVQKFKLPAQPVLYKPQDMGNATVVKGFATSAKALFHVMFGDRSAVFQILYKNRKVDNVVQSPWTKPTQGNLTRTFICTTDSAKGTDVQTIDIQNDHLCYVVSQTQSPWHLPLSNSFHLLTKFVITHSAKSKCKLAIYNKVIWHGPSASFSQHLVQKQALRDYEADAVDLTSVVADQAGKLGAHSKTNKAIQIYGNTGVATQATQVSASDLPAVDIHRTRKTVKRRTLLDLYADEVLVQSFRLLTMVIDIGISLAKSIAGAVSAHKVLVVILAVSVFYNTWYGYRDSLVWYHDRDAAKFMARLGVKSDPSITRAVYLSDIEDLVAKSALETSIGGNDTTAAGLAVNPDDWNSCSGSFRDILTFSDPEITGTGAGSVSGAKGHARRAEARLHRTRHSLARYRHDLLVAMRVVNRVEREVVQAEWEAWIREEERKCHRVASMLADRKQDGAKATRDAKEELGEDFAEYCRSCKREAARIAAG